MTDSVCAAPISHGRRFLPAQTHSAGTRRGRTRRQRAQYREMQRFAKWTKLSETTFVLPQAAEADYQVRIFTADRSSRSPGIRPWAAATPGSKRRRPRRSHFIIQECPAGLIECSRPAGRPAGFAAPPLIRSGPVERTPSPHGRHARTCKLPHGRRPWVDNGPGWVAVLLASAEAVLAVQPRPRRPDDGRGRPYPPVAAAFEVRAFTRRTGQLGEDPVTGSLNAALAGWLRDTGRAAVPYVASQGTAMAAAAGCTWPRLTTVGHLGQRRDGHQDQRHRRAVTGPGRGLRAGPEIPALSATQNPSQTFATFSEADPLASSCAMSCGITQRQVGHGL